MEEKDYPMTLWIVKGNEFEQIHYTVRDVRKEVSKIGESICKNYLFGIQSPTRYLFINPRFIHSVDICREDYAIEST